ncbi:MAG: S1 RNA-binding domain-containing protein [Oscillospiraceae bacterium]|nr:S1 RNA-binding domain-containing protein [Oscillospiraceae bacterium]
MSLVEGSVVDGKITGLTKFGAFVELPEGKTGMVHISEVASTFVKEISDFLTVGQEVKVKVLTIDEAGKISLSIKKASDEIPSESEGQPKPQKSYNKDGGTYQNKRGGNHSGANVWTGQKQNAITNENMSFEEMMSKFKQVSDEKMTDLKRSSESKHGGGFNRRGGNRQYK